MYIVPQVLVTQEFNLLPTALTDPLRAFICGPNYSVSGWLSTGGVYNPAAATHVYDWPSQPANSTIDLATVQVKIKNAYMNYLTIASITSATTPNLVTTASVLAGTGSVSTRAVKVGDPVVLTGTSGLSLRTKVKSLEYVYTESAVSAAVAGASNAADGSAAVSITAATASDVGNYSTDGTYAGEDYGYPTETYQFYVLNDDPAGFDPTVEGAILYYKVISGSGTDNVNYATLTLTAAQTSSTTDGNIIVPLGTRGLSLVLDESTVYYLGDTVDVEVECDFEAPDVTVSGTYTGDIDTVYTVEVLSSTSPLAAILKVTTNNGYDGTARVSVADEEVDVNVGNYGVKIQFAWTAEASGHFAVGDTWAITATAAAQDGLKAFKTTDVISSALIADTPISAAFYTVIDVDLDAEDFEATKDDITLDAALTGTDPEVLEGGIIKDMAIAQDVTGTYNAVYVSYRALLTTYADEIHTIDDIGEVASTLGTVSEDNPLAMGVYFALANCNGTEVKYMAVPTDDLAGYSAVVEKLSNVSNVYGLVPLSKAADVQTLFAGHVDIESSAENAKWRICFLNSDAEEYTAVTTENNAGGIAYADITAVGDGTYTVTAVNTSFETDGVQEGDILRTAYEVDGTYSSYVISEVISNTTLTLESGTVLANHKIEVWHPNTKLEIATAYGAKSGSFGSRRVFHVWPDQIEFGTDLISGVYLCSAIAGLVSGVVPQQGLTNLAITGFTAVSRTTSYFTKSQLDVMAEAGTFIVAQDADSGAIHARHQLSTDMTDLNKQELSVTKNVDSMSYVFARRLAPYIGIANVTPTFLSQLDAEITGVFDYLISSSNVTRLGGQLIAGTIEELRAHTLYRDKVVVVLGLTIPYPVNNIYLSLVV